MSALLCGMGLAAAVAAGIGLGRALASGDPWRRHRRGGVR